MTTTPSLIDELLAEQRSLTAVERFSRAHDEDSPALLAPRYRELIPLERPAPGEQYAFEVELEKCSGCKACVTACHSLNGLDDNETWREVGLLIEKPKRQRHAERADANSNHSALHTPHSAFQHVTTACHHCADPGCLNGCPVLAYEKDPVTGIVRHLDDQCIGCQYCVLKCPYDVPKYNARLGIVRKCDMCSSRLAVGEAPACVQACPSEAIRITKVNTSTVTIEFRERGKEFMTGAPDGDYTLPTTRYIQSAVPRTSTAEQSPEETMVLHRDTAALVAADFAATLPQPAHWPLVVMLVLSQAAVGVAGFAQFQRAAQLPLLLMSLALAVVGLGASVFHLGRPLGAWRAFLNLKRSWMSREIVVFGMFPPLLAIAVAQAFGAPILSSVRIQIGAALIGLLGVFCSVMIYHDTRRPLWHCWRSLPLFFGTTLVLGTAGANIFLKSPALVATLVLGTIAKLLIEVLVLRHITDRALTPLKKTALLVTGKFQAIAMVRLASALLGGIGLPILIALEAFPSVHFLAVLAFGLLVAGELMERFLFFTAVAAPKMPGGLPT